MLGCLIVEAESGLKCWNWQLWRAAYYIDSIHSNLAAYYSNSEQHGSSRHIKNEIKMQQTRKIRIEEISTEKSRIEKSRTGKNRKKV